MNPRVGFSLVFILLSAILAVCSVLARKSKRSIGPYVSRFCLSLIPPLAGNLIIIALQAFTTQRFFICVKHFWQGLVGGAIIASGTKTASIVGYYSYFLGMDLVMISLVRFTDRYCQGIGNGRQKPTFMYFALAADFVQMVMNIFLGHAFGAEKIIVQGSPYYRVVPHFGQFTAEHNS